MLMARSGKVVIVVGTTALPRQKLAKRPNFLCSGCGSATLGNMMLRKQPDGSVVKIDGFDTAIMGGGAVD